MPEVLSKLSQLLESAGAIVTADDLAALDDEVRSMLLTLGLLKATRTATHVVCDACHDDHVEEVMRIKGRSGEVTFRMYCPESGWVEVSSERLRQWSVDLGRLAVLLADGAQTGQPPQELIRAAAWRLGNLEIAGETYSVVFLRCTGHDVAALAQQLAEKSAAGRTIVVTAGEPPAALGQFAAAVSLPAAFCRIGERFELQLPRIRSELRIDVAAAGNVFQRRGQVWVLSFEGKTVYMNDSVGMVYIARLLSDPHREIAAVSLLAARAGIDPRVASGSSGPILDAQARKNYERRYNELQEELAEAKAHNDLGHISRTQAEMETLAAELASATGLGGRDREQTDAERVRKSVSMAVSRDIQKIDKEHTSLAAHLTAFINSGQVFRYAPEPRIDWLT